MLPQSRPTVASLRRAFIAGVVVALAACGPRQTPEAQVRAVVAQAEHAAEARDLSGIMDFVSADYRDEQGNGTAELKQYLRGYLIAHQSVHLLVKVNSVEFPYRDLAKLGLTLGALGRESGAATAFDVAADVYDVELELRLEGGEWRATRARWRPASEG